MPGSTLTLPTPPRFHFAQTVCSYGYFMLAPNHWNPDEQALYRLERTSDHRLAQLRIRMTRRDRLTINANLKLTRDEAHAIKQGVARMLRLNEQLPGWSKAHPKAHREGFGRIFRSPTFFEDAVKTITGCNTAWSNTTTMNRLLCAHFGQGAFPTPHQLADVDPADLKAKTKVGYRADRITRLARQITDGSLDPGWFDAPDRTEQQLYDALIQLHGFGDYAASNMLQALGHYDRLPIDSETVRHFREHHDMAMPTSAGAQRDLVADHYARYAPYRFLAYWWELWRSAEANAGPATAWRSKGAWPPEPV